MELWIIITIAAAFFQNIRSTFQKYLKETVGTTGATFVRFGYGVPFAFIYLVLLQQVFETNTPEFTSNFWLWVSIAAMAQIAATVLLLQTFAYRNFVVGSAYSRTEPAQTALFALVLFGEALSLGGIFAILISTIGVILLSVARTELTTKSLLSALASPAAVLGLASGTLFGLAAVGYRAATQGLLHDLFLMRSATTLCVAISLQTVVMLIWIFWKEREEFSKIVAAWKPALLVGFTGATASFGWFTAFTLQQAALVKVVAQIEMIFTFASAVFFFKESINRSEIAGCLLIITGIIMLILL